MRCKIYLRYKSLTCRAVVLKVIAESIPVVQARWSVLLHLGRSRLLTMDHMVGPIMVLKTWWVLLLEGQ
uniref:Uncharacterized protein n=1 Tax=Arundo donax TaxID=35708 RepID=A0A0A9CKN5_ARUDO